MSQYKDALGKKCFYNIFILFFLLLFFFNIFIREVINNSTFNKGIYKEFKSYIKEDIIIKLLLKRYYTRVINKRIKYNLNKEVKIL